MKFLDFLILLLLLVLFGLGAYVFWLNYPLETPQYKEYKFNASSAAYSSGAQFYPNMRYRDRVISYTISDSCEQSKKNDVEAALLLLSDRTILEFEKKDSSGEINILCSDIAPKPDEEGHFVAGEGGPSEIINMSNYAVIFSGKVSLYRENECENPNIALHEILHALGFDHNENQRSIMYPITKCDQVVDNYIIEEINRLYKTDSKADLFIERIAANRSGRYLNFEISIGNFGLQDSRGAKLIISADGEFVKDFDLEEIEIGTRKILTVENLRIPRNVRTISFAVKGQETELEIDNNVIDIEMVES